MADRTLEQPGSVQDMLCLALHSASRAMTHRYRGLLEQFGVTYPQYLVLTVLHRQGPASLVSLGTELQLESSTLSPLVKRLESMGLVGRSRNTVDERVVILTLTPAGQDLNQRMEILPSRIGTATGLSAEDQGRLLQTLHQLECDLRS